MHYTSPIINSTGTAELRKMVEQRKAPDHENYKNQHRIESLVMMEHPQLDSLEWMIEKLAESTQPGGTQKTYVESNLSHWRTIVYNFIRTTATNQWLGVPGNVHDYTSGGYYSRIGLAYKGTQKVLGELIRRGWITEQTGKKFQNKPRVNHYYPSEQFQDYLIDYAMFTDNPSSFDGSLLTINEPDPEYAQFQWKRDHPDYLPLTEINEFARTQQWACRSAITQSFKNTPFQSGRLITPFQNLHSRNYKVRINTLINGNPIAEVDFNANHLRMFLAFNKRDVIGDYDAYEPIASESGVERKKAKAFINVGLNNQSFEATKHVIARIDPYVSYKESNKIAEAFNKLYPNLELYCGFALTAMQLEGLILKDVLLRGVRAGVLALPIHDAVAVEFDHQDWAKDAMEDAWQSVMTEFHKTAKTSVTIKFTS
ncbi:hypothetical protein N9W43_08495 [Litoricolaceae bacterium]|nr:hypothetical protein [Litorivicinaceae bacterium]